MARWATLVEIAGVSFTGCRAEVLDGEPFLSQYVGSSQLANSFVPNVQVVNRGVKGIDFGIQMASNETTKIQQALTAIQTSQGLNQTFVVKIIDGIYNINVNAVPDYNQFPYLKMGKHSEGWYEDIIWRFTSKSQGV